MRFCVCRPGLLAAGLVWAACFAGWPGNASANDDANANLDANPHATTHANANANADGDASTAAKTTAAPSALRHAVAVQVPSLDKTRTGETLKLPGFWFALKQSEVAPAAARPALVLMHGCGGPYASSGQLAQRYTEITRRLHTMGIHTLVTDSFTPRGERELCTQRNGQRKVTQLQRRRDALGALQWLAQQPGVDPQRLGLLGWSNGGSTVLAATNLQHPEVAAAPVRASLAVAFYPGCESELQRGYVPAAPLLMLLGQADDWTPAEPCQRLAQAVHTGPKPQVQQYAGAYHGFDGTAPLRLRVDVPNGVNPGAGVHVGANLAARSAATQHLQDYLRAQWGL